MVVKGLISKPQAGAGRTSTDRQFYFINGRPFEAKVCLFLDAHADQAEGRTSFVQAISKGFNEIYKAFVPTHYPSVVADFQLSTDSYDVNVSPDKRSILLHSEKNLVEALKVDYSIYCSKGR